MNTDMDDINVGCTFSYLDDIKVGDTFECEGKTYMCVEDDITAETISCENTCALYGDVLCACFACTPEYREDGKNVHLEEVESCK